MTVSEFSNEFDVYYNSIATNAAPSIDLYEKSVYLTKAQLEIVKNCLFGLGYLSVKCQGQGAMSCARWDIGIKPTEFVCSTCNKDTWGIACKAEWTTPDCKLGGPGRIYPFIIICPRSWSGDTQIYDNPMCELADTIIHELLHLCGMRHKVIGQDPDNYKDVYYLAETTTRKCFCECKNSYKHKQ